MKKLMRVNLPELTPVTICKNCGTATRVVQGATSFNACSCGKTFSSGCAVLQDIVKAIRGASDPLAEKWDFEIAVEFDAVKVCGCTIDGGGP